MGVDCLSHDPYGRVLLDSKMKAIGLSEKAALSSVASRNLRGRNMTEDGVPDTGELPLSKQASFIAGLLFTWMAAPVLTLYWGSSR